MTRPLTIGALTLAVGVAYGLYELSYEVQRLEGDLARFNRQLLEAQDTVQVLHAEWSYLNRPQSLQRLSAKHLDLAPIEPHQVVARVADLPVRGDPALAANRVPMPRPRPAGIMPATPATRAAANTVVYREIGQ